MPKICGKSSPTISPAVVINNDLTFQLQLISKELNKCVKKIPEQYKNRLDDLATTILFLIQSTYLL